MRGRDTGTGRNKDTERQSDRDRERHFEAEFSLSKGLKMKKLIRTAKRKCYTRNHFLVEAQGSKEGKRLPLLIILRDTE